MTRLRHGIALAGTLFCSACAPNQGILNPGGPQAGRIGDLWLLLVWVAVIVWVAVAAFLIAALMRRSAAREKTQDARMRKVVGAATVSTIVVLFVILVASVRTGTAMASLPPTNALDVEITANQWWWQIKYPNQRPDQIVTTANEFHIPVGVPVRLKVTSQDVIHSVWVPALGPKMDAIPSRINVIWLQADHPGRFRGQCSEFCGQQHAHMILYAFADTPAEFAKWLENQRKPAPDPASPELIEGQQVFLNGPCPVCHTIRGTPANGSVAPDLTHLSSRQTIAAGTMPNNRGSLGGWVTDSQRVKPGNHMPPVSVASKDLGPLLSYLGSLR